MSSSEPAPERPEHPILLERYKLVRQRHSSGWTLGYGGEDLETGKYVSITLSRYPHLSPGRFPRELTTLQEFRHPGILPVQSAGLLPDGVVYIIRSGGYPYDLKHDLLDRGPIPWRNALDLGVHLSEALQAAHERGIQHLDLQPETICWDGGFLPLAKVMLTEVGSAWLSRPLGLRAISDQEPSQIAERAGPPGYAPPETYNGRADARCDVFSLGVLLYALIAGERPYDDAFARAGSMPVVPPDVASVLLRAVSLEPGDRFPSMAEFHAALVNLCDVHPRGGGPEYWLAGKFDIRAILGVGHTSTVYLARERSMRRKTALKVLRDDLADDPVERVRFKYECVILSNMRDFAFPRPTDSSKVGRCNFAALDLCPGLPADSFIRDESRLKAREVLAVGRQITRALIDLHHRGVIHRDIHARNVLIERGADLRVSLLDLNRAFFTEVFFEYMAENGFSVSKPVQEALACEVELENTGYLAPEVLLERRFSPASDSYALGALLFQLMSGRLPPGLDDDADPYWRPRPGEPQASLAHIVRAMLHPNPHVRLSVSQARTEMLALDRRGGFY